MESAERSFPLTKYGFNNSYIVTEPAHPDNDTTINTKSILEMTKTWNILLKWDHDLFPNMVI